MNMNHDVTAPLASLGFLVVLLLSPQTSLASRRSSRVLLALTLPAWSAAGRVRAQGAAEPRHSW